MAQYGKAAYWDERYTRDPEPFDWYQRWTGVRDIIMEHIKPTQNFLVIGAGNSRLSEEMYEEGFRKQTNVDISSVVVKAMAEKYADKEGMSYVCMDLKQMELGDAAFNAVIDKGTLDSLLCGEASTLNVQKALSEIARVLDTTGVFISISHGQPSYRLTYLQRLEFGWDVSVHTVAKPIMGVTGNNIGTEEKENVHYVYVCERK